MPIPIDIWAVQHLPYTKLSKPTLNSYARTQRFDPPAIKIGRTWHVDEHAILKPSSALPLHYPASTDPVVNRIFTSV